MSLQTTFNEISAKASDLNAQLNIKLQDPSASVEDIKQIRDELNETKSRRDLINHQLKEEKAAAEAKAVEDAKNNTTSKGNIINPKNNDKVKDMFHKYLQECDAKKRVTNEVSGIVRQDGQVLIPDTILTPEHEENQFARLGNMIRTVSVSTTTGKIPVFKNNKDTLSEHKEYSETNPNKTPEISQINWDLKTYTGRYVFSQDLISDSSYNWEGELSGELIDLRDNTNDSLIIKALTDNVDAEKADDLIDGLKNILDSKLKPHDSNSASIVLSQSAFYELDKMKDGEGRPLVQPDVTKSTGQSILGKSFTVVADDLFPGAQTGDVNVVVAPLEKAVINFKNNEITGEFQDTHDIWYKSLGIYLREDIVQARKDLIFRLSSQTAKSLKTTDK